MEFIEWKRVVCITNRKRYDQVFGGTFLKPRSVKHKT